MESSWFTSVSLFESLHCAGKLCWSYFVDEENKTYRDPIAYPGRQSLKSRDGIFLFLPSGGSAFSENMEELRPRDQGSFPKVPEKFKG